MPIARAVLHFNLCLNFVSVLLIVRTLLLKPLSVLWLAPFLLLRQFIIFTISTFFYFLLFSLSFQPYSAPPPTLLYILSVVPSGLNFGLSISHCYARVGSRLFLLAPKLLALLNETTISLTLVHTDSLSQSILKASDNAWHVRCCAQYLPRQRRWTSNTGTGPELSPELHATIKLACLVANLFLYFLHYSLSRPNLTSKSVVSHPHLSSLPWRSLPSHPLSLNRLQEHSFFFSCSYRDHRTRFELLNTSDYLLLNRFSYFSACRLSEWAATSMKLAGNVFHFSSLKLYHSVLTDVRLSKERIDTDEDKVEAVQAVFD